MRILALGLLVSCSDYKVSSGEPDLALSSRDMDFGEVVVGNQLTVGVTAENQGIGSLEVFLVELDGTTSADFTLDPVDTTRLDPGEQTEFLVRFVPDGVGQDYGRVAVFTDDPDEPLAEIALSAFGVEPRIDVDPESLWFGEVSAGTTETRDVQVSALGSGSLEVSAMTLIGVSDDAFSVMLPSGVSLPYAMAAGTAFTFTVQFAPTDSDPRTGQIEIVSNDPYTPEVPVVLLGNTADDPTGNAEPVVELVDPNWGEYFLEGDTIEIRGVVYDEEDAVTTIACAFYADGTPLGAAFPDADGNVSLSTDALPAGDVKLVLRAFDSEGAMGEDDVDVRVWAPDEPIEYTISGGLTLFDYWTVDDDVTITIDGVTVFADTNDAQDTHPPVSFEADRGAHIRIVVTDSQYCTSYLDQLILHFGTSAQQVLNAEECISACDDHPCYDAGFAPDWPYTFVDETYVISIP